MSARITTYVRRHVLIEVSRSKGLIMSVVADIADDNGRAPVTQPMIAHDIGCSLSTVEKHMRPLLRDKFLAKGGGRTYVVVGAAEHDVMVCPHVECAAEAEVMRRGATSAHKRAQAAARARRMRERRKREAAELAALRGRGGGVTPHATGARTAHGQDDQSRDDRDDR